MSSNYTQQGYTIVATEDESSRHWFGGEPYHSGAKCPVCKIPLLLLADLDCLALREKEAARLFHELDRLPLYYCWRCVPKPEVRMAQVRQARPWQRHERACSDPQRPLVRPAHGRASGRVGGPLSRQRMGPSRLLGVRRLSDDCGIEQVRLRLRDIDVVTMNGNRARAFQFLGVTAPDDA